MNFKVFLLIFVLPIFLSKYPPIFTDISDISVKSKYRYIRNYRYFVPWSQHLKHVTKKKLFYYFFLEIVSLSQKRTPVASESLYHNKDSRRNSYVTPGAWSHAPKLPVKCVARAACVSCVLCAQSVWPSGRVTTQ